MVIVVLAFALLGVTGALVFVLHKQRQGVTHYAAVINEPNDR